MMVRKTTKKVAKNKPTKNNMKVKDLIAELDGMDKKTVVVYGLSGTESEE